MTPRVRGLAAAVLRAGARVGSPGRDTLQAGGSDGPHPSTHIASLHRDTLAPAPDDLGRSRRDLTPRVLVCRASTRRPSRERTPTVACLCRRCGGSGRARVFRTSSSWRFSAAATTTRGASARGNQRDPLVRTVRRRRPASATPRSSAERTRARVARPWRQAEPADRRRTATGHVAVSPQTG